MNSYRLLFPITMMANVLGVSRSGYYWWLDHKPSARQIRHEELKPKILAAHALGRETYGPKRIQSTLADQGTAVGRDQIDLLRKEMGLRCIQKTKFKQTTNSDHNLPVAPNLLNQSFQTSEAGTVWGSDITYIATGEGWLYLAGIKDFHTKEIVGYQMQASMTQDLVRLALNRALSYRKPLPGCIVHSDRGSQYCSKDYQQDLKRAGLRVSMSRRGNCYDNAPTESFWSTLKQELIYRRRFATRLQAQQAIREYIEIFYNRIRKHSALGNKSPAVFATKSIEKRRSA